MNSHDNHKHVGILFFIPYFPLIIFFLYIFRNFLLLIFFVVLILCFIIKDHFQKDEVIQLIPNFGLSLLGYSSGVFLFFIGKISGIWILQEVSIIITLSGLILAMVGNKYFKILILPLILILFIFIFTELSLSGNVITELKFNFQIFSASVAYLIFKIMGVQVFQSWENLFLPHVNLIIVEECSGYSHIMALFLLTLPLAITGRKTFLQKLLLIVLALCLGIILNGMRVVFMGLWSYIFGIENLHGPQNLFYSGIIFFIGGILLMVISFEIDRFNSRSKQIISRIQYMFPAIKTHTLKLLFIIFPVTLMTIFIEKFQLVSVSLPVKLENFPQRIGLWEGINGEIYRNRFELTHADDQVKRVYWNEKNDSLQFYVAYFERQQNDNEIISYRMERLYKNTIEKSIDLVGQAQLKINMSELSEENRKLTIFYWYIVKNKIFTNRFFTKLATMKEAILNQKNNGAIVMIIIKNSKEKDKTQVINEISDFISYALPDIYKYLKM